MENDKKHISTIGQRIPRADSALIASGEAQYLDDIRIPGMLHGRILRSPHPHAKIRSIDTRKAERVLGVKAVITAADTPKIPFCHMPVTPNKLPLCSNKVRFIGDEVAAVAALDVDIAEEAVSLIQVEYEILPAVFDPLEAMKPDAPMLYDDCEKNIASRLVRNFGDVAKGLSEADFIFEDVFELPRVASCTLEPHGCIAQIDSQGNLTVWSSTQSITNIHEEVGIPLGLPLHKIRVIAPFVGGAFGNKSVILPLEPITAFLARKAQRPVKIVTTREEEFTCSRTRYAMIIRLKTGVKKDGAITFRDAQVITDNGAYNNKAQGITMVTCNRIGNLYRVPHVRTEALIVYTNNQYGGALRGWGGPQAHFAVESQMDIIANQIGFDPLDFRLRNVNQPGDKTVWGWEITSCGFSDCLRRAAQEIGWPKRREKKKFRGIGIAGAVHSGGGSMGAHGPANFEEVLVKLNSDGTVNVSVGCVDMGQGSSTVLAQIVAEELGVDTKEVKVITPDTDNAPRTMGPWGSRITFIAGNAARKAAAEVKSKMLAIAKDLLDVTDTAHLGFENGEIFVRNTLAKHLGIREVTEYFSRHFGQAILGRGFYNPENTVPPDRTTGYGNTSPAYSFCAHAAEVEVDPETGKVEVIKIVAAHDIGKAINPMLVEGQIDGGIAMGIGYALLEELKFDNGKTLNPTFAGYKILNSTEKPRLHHILIETDDPNGPFGAKGVGEIAMIPTAPAIANAIYDAVGVRIKELPISQGKILKALKAKVNSI